jgi:outer membrane protein OmpA-like peptidoglycan-associated protein
MKWNRFLGHDRQKPSLRRSLGDCGNLALHSFPDCHVVSLVPRCTPRNDVGGCGCLLGRVGARPSQLLSLALVTSFLMAGCVSGDTARIVKHRKLDAPQRRAATTPALAINHPLFGFDSAALTTQAKREISKVVRFMKAQPRLYALLRGHTCADGDAVYNQYLGQRRADAVKNYMVQSGIDAKRIGTESLGESKPALRNTDAENKQRNRRVEITVYRMEEK